MLSELRSLDRSDRRLVFEAASLMAVAWMALHLVGFPVVRRMLGYYIASFRSRRFCLLPAATRDVRWAVAAVAARLPPATCLIQALAADAMLRRRGLACELRIGVRPRSDERRSRRSARMGGVRRRCGRRCHRWFIELQGAARSPSTTRLEWLNMVKVLLVDDDPDLRSLLSVWLDGSDFELTLAADGYQGLQFARTDHPDVILLDIHMPVAKGFLVHERLKRMPALANVPVIYISADRTAEMQAMSAGARFLAKPLDKEVLMRTLRDAYDQAS